MLSNLYGIQTMKRIGIVGEHNRNRGIRRTNIKIRDREAISAKLLWTINECRRPAPVKKWVELEEKMTETETEDVKTLENRAEKSRRRQ
ncbi:hypothetical protein YC2023_101375 [Brassica napus]